MLGRDSKGSMAAGQGPLLAALASLLDSFDSFDRMGEGLHLNQNRWDNPPGPIVEGGMPAVRAYFEAIFSAGTDPVTRPLKVVIVGKESVGKTSLRHSIKTGKPFKTRQGDLRSTVHVDVEDHKVDGHRIRMFDCAGQVAYYGLLQLFLTRHAVYLLVWDAEQASKTDDLDLEDLVIAPWLRYMTFRVPDANVVLVGNKWDRVERAKHTVASDVETRSRECLAAWIKIKKARGHQPHALTLEAGVSLVSCAPRVRVKASLVGGKTSWPCDKSKPGLLHRITHNPPTGANPAGDTRAVTMSLPPSYRLALEMLEELESCRRNDEEPAPIIARASLEEKWQTKVAELNRAGPPIAAPEAAMSGAILIRKWEGGLVEYGSYIFLDVRWFASILDPVFSHKKDSLGNVGLGGTAVTNVASLDRLNKENILEPKLAEEIWGEKAAQQLLSALQSAGLAFPLPDDDNHGLVILLRMSKEKPPDYETKLNDVHQTHDLRLVVECEFCLGLPPGFVERLLARCCRLGYPCTFWRHGALVVGDGAEEGLFLLSLEYSEEKKILRVEVYGGCKKVDAWAALSKVLSVTIRMRSEYPGLPWTPRFFCPRHENEGKYMSIRETDDAQPGSRLVEEVYICSLCKGYAACKNLMQVALPVVDFSDTEFFDTQLRDRFAENDRKVALQDGAPWPGSNFKVGALSPICIGFSRANRLMPFSLPNCFTLAQSAAGPASTQIGPGNQDSRTPWFQDVNKWIGIANVACLSVFGVFAAQEDDDARLWGVFLGLGMLLLGVDIVVIVREYKLLCFKRSVGAASARKLD
ncbi:unnamed protein product [Laminaria digitata]